MLTKLNWPSPRTSPIVATLASETVYLPLSSDTPSLMDVSALRLTAHKANIIARKKAANKSSFLRMLITANPHARILYYYMLLYV
jgi:hypothetical protein